MSDEVLSMLLSEAAAGNIGELHGEPHWRCVANLKAQVVCRHFMYPGRTMCTVEDVLLWLFKQELEAGGPTEGGGA